MSFSNNFPTTSPSLELDFANVNALDPRITFTRSSIATVTNSLGLLQTVQANVPRFDYDPVTLAPRGLLIEEQRANLLTYSEYFDNAAWTKLKSSVSANTAVAPDGATAADKFVEDSTAGIHQMYQSFTQSAGVSYIYSVYAKAAERTRIRLTDDTATNSATFDLSSGTVISGSGVITAVGNGWFRCSAVYSAATTSIYISLVVGANNNYTGDGTSGVFIWGAQLEAGAFPTSYVPSTQTFTGRTSTGTFIGSNGLVQTAGVGVARMQYNPTNLNAQPFLLLEAAATNLITYSEDFSNAAWTKRGTCTVTSNAVAAPDGTVTADLISGLGGSGNDLYSTVATVTLNAPDAPSFFINKVSTTGTLRVGNPSDSSKGNWYIDLSLVGSGWQRITPGHPAVTVITSFVGNGGGDGLIFLTQAGGPLSFYLWGAQLEAGSFATSYIPTVATTVTRSADTSTSSATTRNADLASMTGTAFSSWYNQNEGTFYFEGVQNATNGTQSVYAGTRDTLSGGNSNLTLFYINNTARSIQLTSYDPSGVIQTDINGNTPLLNQGVAKKAAFALQLNNFAQVSDGGTVQTDTSALMPSPAAMSIGRNPGSGSFINGYIRKIAYYPIKLSSAQLQAITT